MDIVGGGRGQPCILPNYERIQTGIICYSDVGIQYDIWWWIITSLFIINTIWAIYLAVQMYLTKDNVNKLRQTTIGINILVMIVRLVWLGCIYNGRTPDSIVGGYLVDPLLLTVGRY